MSTSAASFDAIQRFSEPKFHRDDFAITKPKKKKRSSRYRYFRRYLGFDPCRYGSTHRCYGKMKVRFHDSHTIVKVYFYISFADRLIHSSDTWQHNVKTCLLCCVLSMFLCFLLVELETNWWFLDDEGVGDSESDEYEVPNPQLKDKWKYWIVLLKFVIMSVNAFTFIFNTHYHVLKLYLELARQKISDERMLTVWQVPRAKFRVLFEGILLMISPIPWVNYSISLKVGVGHVHDPSAHYRIDIFVFILMMLLRWKYVYRFIYVRQDLFTQDGMVLSTLTGTRATPSLGFRSFTEENPITIFVYSFGIYLGIVAYLHNKLEGPTNYWPESRHKKMPILDDEGGYTLVKQGHHPVTFANSFWLHFIAFSTIGFGEYLVQTYPGRFLIMVSFFAGLILTSFAINILFKKLAIDTSEQFLLEKLQSKKLRKSYAEAALLVIQRLVRSFLLNQEIKMLKSGSERRTFTTSRTFNNGRSGRSNGVNMKEKKKKASKGRNKIGMRRGTLFNEDDEIEVRARMKVAAGTALNLCLFDWRAIRQEFNKLEISAFDTEKGLNDVDSRTSKMEKMMHDLYSDVALIGEALNIMDSKCGSSTPKPYMNRASTLYLKGLQETMFPARVGSARKDEGRGPKLRPEFTYDDRAYEPDESVFEQNNPLRRQRSFSDEEMKDENASNQHKNLDDDAWRMI